MTANCLTDTLKIVTTVQKFLYMNSHRKHSGIAVYLKFSSCNFATEQTATVFHHCFLPEEHQER